MIIHNIQLIIILIYCLMIISITLLLTIVTHVCYDINKLLVLLISTVNDERACESRFIGVSQAKFDSLAAEGAPFVSDSPL